MRLKSVKLLVHLASLLATAVVFQNMGWIANPLPAKVNFAFDDHGGATGLDVALPKQLPLDIDTSNYGGSIILPGGRVVLSSGDEAWKVSVMNYDGVTESAGQYPAHRVLRGKRWDQVKLIDANADVMDFLNARGMTLDQFRPISAIRGEELAEKCAAANLGAKCFEGAAGANRRTNYCAASKITADLCTPANFALIGQFADHCVSRGLNQTCSAPTDYRLNGHSSASFDPRFAERAYRVASPDACVNATVENTGYNPKGEYECYKLMLFVPILKSGLDAKGEWVEKLMQTPSINEATVVVRAFYKNSGARLSGADAPELTVAQIDNRWRLITYLNQAGQPTSFRGYEMTTTADSRLLVFAHLGTKAEADQAAPRADSPLSNPRSSWLGVMFNPRPWDPNSQWTQPIAYQDMYKIGDTVACFGLTEVQCKRDQALRVKLSARYPVLAQIGRNPDGTPFESVSTCSYPWISADGEELFCGLTGLGAEDGRSSFAAFGRRTNWTWTVIDSTLNRLRGGCPGADECHGILRSQTFGMTSGTWAIPREMDLDQLGIRRTPDQYVLSLMGYAPNRIDGASFLGVANFRSYTDGNYLAYFNFNEQVQSPDGVKQRTWDLAHTPDVSGNFLHGNVPDGVHFFYETAGHNNGDPRQNSEKWVGNSIYTNDGAFVALQPSKYTPKSVVKALSEPLSTMTVEFAFKPMRAVPSRPGVECLRTLVEKPGTFKVCLSGESKIEVQLKMGGYWYSTKSIDYPVRTGEWTHVAVRLRRGAGLVVNLFSHADETSDQSRRFKFTELTHANGRVKRPVAAPLDAGKPVFYVGPREGQGLGPDVFGFDEFKFSKIDRDDYDIADSEFSRVQRPFQKLVNTDLPLGLDPVDARVPERIADVINGPRVTAVAQLGNDLFNDVNLSRSSRGPASVSCATCHAANQAFTDGLAQSVGTDGLKTGKNAPTIFNRAFAVEQMFNQNKSSIAVQAGGPITNPREMNGDLDLVVQYLRTKKQAAFDTAYGKKTTITPQLVMETLGVFMFQTTSGDSRMDRFMAGTLNFANTDRVLQGMKVFNDKGRCVGCHGLSNFSDELRHSTGVRLNAAIEDDEAFVKTPTMRNIAATAPYFHDGSAANLKGVVDFYARGGDVRTNQTEIVATPLSAQEKSDLIRFLGVLTSRDNRVGGH